MLHQLPQHQDQRHYLIPSTRAGSIHRPDRECTTRCDTRFSTRTPPSHLTRDRGHLPRLVRSARRHSLMCRPVLDHLVLVLDLLARHLHLKFFLHHHLPVPQARH